MDIKELIQKLSKLDQDTQVVLSKDPEGNSFHSLLDIEECYCSCSSIGNGEVEPVEPNSSNAKKSVILFPS